MWWITIVDRKRVVRLSALRGSFLSLSPPSFLLSFFSSVCNAYPFLVSISWPVHGRRPAIMSCVNGSLKEATPEQPFSANKARTRISFLSLLLFSFPCPSPTHINFIADFNSVSLQSLSAMLFLHVQAAVFMIRTARNIVLTSIIVRWQELRLLQWMIWSNHSL